MIMSNFAELLGDLLFDQQLTAKQLAEKIGMETSTITRYVRAERFPTVENLIRIADYFQCSIDYLLGLEAENYSASFCAPPNFAKRIDYFLEKYHLTAYQFSKKVGISEACIYSWKNNKRKPTIEGVVKIATALDCSVDFVLGREN